MSCAAVHPDHGARAPRARVTPVARLVRTCPLGSRSTRPSGCLTRGPAGYPSHVGDVVGAAGPRKEASPLLYTQSRTHESLGAMASLAVIVQYYKQYT